MSDASDAAVPGALPRRRFLQAGLAAGAAALVQGQARAQEDTGMAEPFRLDYAPHFGMFQHHAGRDPIDQIRFMHDQGFRSLEDNGMRHRSPEEQERIGKELDRLGMRMGVFVGHTRLFGARSFSAGDPGERETFLKDLQASVEIAKRVNAKYCTIVPGDLEPRLEIEYQTANVIEQLKAGCEICEPAGLVMVIEPLNPFRDHPGMFLSKISQAYLICRAVGSPSLKILFDIYHQQITEGNLIPNIDRAWDEIGYFQIGDNPGRNEPTTGEINYKNVFAHIHARGYRGIMGMEHGNSQPGKEGEQALIAAYREVDAFTP